MLILAPLDVLLPHRVPLVAATLLQRRDRFIADVRTADGVEHLAHCVNPGRMEDFVRVGSAIWLLPSADSAPADDDGGGGASPPRRARKCAFTWELLEFELAPAPRSRFFPDAAVVCGTNTQRPNDIVRALLESRQLAGLDDWSDLRAEQFLPHDEPPPPPGSTTKRAARSRVDFALVDRDGADHYVEVKNCHSVVEGHGYFPDSVTERGARHLGELAALLPESPPSPGVPDAGATRRCTVIFVVQRADVSAAVRPSDWHDPTFAAAARAASARGVRFRAVKVVCNPVDGYRIVAEIPVDLERYDTAPVAAACAAAAPHTGWMRTAGKGSSPPRLVANGEFKHNQPPKQRKRKAATEANGVKEED